MGQGRIKRSGLLVLVVVLLTVAGCGGSDGGEDGGDAAHINESTGSVNGVVPDERVGTAPRQGKEMKLSKAADAAGCYLLRNIPLEDDEAPAPGTPGDPPTSGPHVAPPNQQADGAYLTTPEEPATVASLNSGRMLIQYAPDLAEDIQLELKGLYDSMYGGTLFFPNSTMEFAITATTWTNGMLCTGWEGAATLNAIRAFGKATWGKYGNVPVDKFPVEGPTPADPEEPRKAKSE